VDIQPIVATAIYTSKTHGTEGTEFTLTCAERLARRGNRLRRQAS